MTEELTPEDKALFLKVWNLKDGELTDEEILMAIKLGQLKKKETSNTYE